MFRQSKPIVESTDSFAVASSGTALLLVGTSEREVRLFTRGDRGWKHCNTSLSSAASQGAAVTSAVTAVEVNRDRNVAVVACSDGNVSLWHLGSRQLVHAYVETQVDEHGKELKDANEIYVAKMRPTHGVFATGGKDAVVRLYDEETLALTSVLMAGAEDGQLRAHSSKINALAWLDEHTLITGGWDYTMQVWDTRQGRSLRSVYGPYLCADGIDVHPAGKAFLTASTRSTEQLQLWDLRTFTKTADVAWPLMKSDESSGSAGNAVVAPSLMAARYSPNGKFIAAGGSRDFRIFEEATHVATLAALDDPPFPVFALRWVGDELIVCGGKTVSFMPFRA